MKTASRVSVSQLITMEWPQLKITPLTPPPALQLLVGWTGTPASTANLVAQMDHHRVKAVYQQFLTASRQCVNAMIEAFQSGDLPAIQHQLAVNRTLLTKLAAVSGINIETPTLTRLVEIACRLGAQAKSSGAGGGDCGIALADCHAPETSRIAAAWQAAGITPLALHVYARRTTNEPARTPQKRTREPRYQAVSGGDGHHNRLAEVRLVPRTMPEIGLDDVDLTTTIAGQPTTAPFFINAMTGGTPETGKLNQQLATAAKETGIAMATGSESVALRSVAAQPSFATVRQTNPGGVVLGNVSATTSPEAAQKAVDLIKANALEVHVNAAQELTMPEGRNGFPMAGKHYGHCPADERPRHHQGNRPGH